MEATLLYKCGDCGELHGDVTKAEMCCAPEVIEMYGCPVCEQVHQEEEDAEVCCEGAATRCPVCARDYGDSSIDSVAINVTGHCRICQPLFSYDQQHEIERIQEHRGRAAEHVHS